MKYKVLLLLLWLLWLLLRWLGLEELGLLGLVELQLVEKQRLAVIFRQKQQRSVKRTENSRKQHVADSAARCSSGTCKAGVKAHQGEIRHDFLRH